MTELPEANYFSMLTNFTENTMPTKPPFEQVVPDLDKEKNKVVVEETNLTARQEDEGNEGWPDEENN